jgi:hypothetical protein
MQISRRAALIGSAALLFARRAVAQDPPTITPSSDLVEWFESLKRPDVEAAIARGEPGAGLGVVSCCGVGDAYPIVIDQEAMSGHREQEGHATVTDPSAVVFNIKEADGTTKMKFRPAVTGRKTFTFSGELVTKEKYGTRPRRRGRFSRS